MVQIKITQHGTVTRLTKPEIERLGNVANLLSLLARHQPMVKEYGIASAAMDNVLSIWGKGDARTEQRDDCPTDAPELGDEESPRGHEDMEGVHQSSA